MMENHPSPGKHGIDRREACEEISECAVLSEPAIEETGFFNRLSPASQQELVAWHQKSRNQHFDDQKKLQSLRDQHFDENNIRASELVEMQQPVLTFAMKKNGGTVSATARTPRAVEEWPDFNQQQRMFAELRKPYFKKIGFIPRVHKPLSLVHGNDCIVYCEKNLQTITEDQLFVILNHLLKDPESETFLVNSAKESCGLNFSCSPDGVTVLWQRDPVSKESTPLRATNCWEYKPLIPVWIFEKGTNVSIVSL